MPKKKTIPLTPEEREALLARLKSQDAELREFRAARSRRAMQATRWRKNNPEKASEAQRRWRRKNPDKVKKSLALYYSRNKADRLAKNKEWRKKNPDKVREQLRRYRLKHRDDLLDKQRARRLEQQKKAMRAHR